MKLNNLLLLALTALATQSAQAMHQNTVDTEAAAQRAQQIATSLANCQRIPEPSSAPAVTPEASRMAQNLESKADAAVLSELPASTPNLAAKECLLTDEFLRYAATLDIPLPKNFKAHKMCTDGRSLMAPLFRYPQKPDKFCVWYIATGKVLEERDIDYSHELTALALTERYQVIAFNKDSTYLEIHDRRTKEITILPINKNNDDYPDYITEIAISNDEQYIAAIHRDHRIFIWHQHKENGWKLVYTGEEKGKSPVPELMFSHNNQLLAIAAHQTIQIIDVKAGKEILNFTNNETINDKNGIPHFTITPDDKYIVLGTYAGYVTIHDITTGKLVRTLSTPDEKDNEIYMVKTNATGEHIITGHRNGRQRIWDFATGKLLRTLQLDQRIVQYTHTKHTCPFIITRDNTQFTGPIKIHLVPEAFLSLLPEQLEFMHELIQTRLRVKEQEKPIILSRKQLELFRQLPIFIQKALAINLNLTLDDSSARGVSEAEDIMTMINAQDGSSTANGLKKLIYEYAQ
jgi:hypothetical protein